MGWGIHYRQSIVSDSARLRRTAVTVNVTIQTYSVSWWWSN